MIIVVLISLTIHSAFYFLVFSRLAIYKEKPKNDPIAKTSVIICYKNEEKKIDKYLPSILQQAFDELILVNDNSPDRTLERLNVYKSEKVKIVSVLSESAGKKKALAEGIREAKNNTILLTDADCKPASAQWSVHMCSGSTSFVLGYGPITKTSGLIGLFARFETYITALQYLSYALMGIPYMGVGRNLRVDKNIVSQQKSKIKGAHLASGDDDLMINSLANKYNTSICIHPDSFVYSDPKTTFKSYIVQKSRHISTSTYYKPIHKILLVLFSGSQLIFFIGLIISLITGTITIKLALLLLLVKWGIQQSINYPVMKKLKEGDLFWKFPFLDILFFVYLLIMPIYYLFNKNNSRWS